MNPHLLTFLALVVPAFSLLAQSDPAVPEQLIREATVRMSVTYAVGWQYSGNTWTKGQSEPGAVGDRGTPDMEAGVRAICLGKETIDGAEFFVFFALRSFVDPLSPSPVIQGWPTRPLGVAGTQLPLPSREGLSPEKSDTLGTNWLTGTIRYGRIDFTWYEDLGGGQFKIHSKLPATVFHDKDEVRVVKGEWFGHPEEKHLGGTYDVPQVNFRVKDHFAMQTDALEGRAAGLRFYENHDAVLIYVPKKAFADAEQTDPPHLGLRQPTLAVDVALRRTEHLFGFKFVLLGQETLDQIERYRPSDYRLSGFEKAAGFIGLAMSPATLGMLKRVDSVLAAVVPDPGAISKWTDLRLYYKTLSGEELGKTGIALISELLGVPVTLPQP
jgi:hypothetical protein